MSKQIVSKSRDEIDLSWRADHPDQVVALHDVMESLGLTGEPIPFRDCLNKKMYIRYIRPFHSRFEDNKLALFVVFGLEGEQGNFQTVIGSGPCMDSLLALVASGVQGVIVATPRWMEGGKYSGYYILE